MNLAASEALANNPTVSNLTRPNFLIAGMMKCGTSSLYKYLCQNSQILEAKTKEIHFFDEHYEKGLSWYLDNFPQIDPESNLITGEATPKYINMPGIEKEMLKLFPKIKLIILLRNPWERTISHYYHHARSAKNIKPIDKALNYQMNLLNSLSEAELIAGEKSLNFVARSLYLYHLMRWMNVFPQEQFLILKSEDMFANPQATIDRCCDFLGVSRFELTEYSIYNSGSYDEVDEGLKNKLKDFFKPHNEKLENYLGVNFNWQ